MCFSDRNTKGKRVNRLLFLLLLLLSSLLLGILYDVYKVTMEHLSSTATLGEEHLLRHAVQYFKQYSSNKYTSAIFDFVSKLAACCSCFLLVGWSLHSWPLNLSNRKKRLQCVSSKCEDDSNWSNLDQERNCLSKNCENQYSLPQLPRQTYFYVVFLCLLQIDTAIVLDADCRQRTNRQICSSNTSYVWRQAQYNYGAAADDFFETIFFIVLNFLPPFR